LAVDKNLKVSPLLVSPQKKPATQHTPLLCLIDQQPKRTPQY
jgi:hypothetical protein